MEWAFFLNVYTCFCKILHDLAWNFNSVWAVLAFSSICSLQPLATSMSWYCVFFVLHLSTILVLRVFLLLFFIFAFVPEKRVLIAEQVLGGSVTCFFLFCICRQFCIFVFAIVPERGSYWQSRCWAVGGNNSRRGRRRPGARNLVRPRKPAHTRL